MNLKSKDRKKRKDIDLHFEDHHNAMISFLLGYFKEWEFVLQFWYLALIRVAFAAVLFSWKRRDYLKKKHSALSSMDGFSELNETHSVSCIKLKLELKKMSTDKNNCRKNKRPRMEKWKPVAKMKL